MSNENTTAQPTATPPAPQAGPSIEELQQKLAEAEKSREGLLRDLQSERNKRQEAESKLTPTVSSTEPNDVTGDELYKVIAPVLDKHPVTKQLRMMEARLAEDKAKAFLTAKTGKKWEDIEADKSLQDKLTSIAQRYKLIGTPDDVVQRAYSILELEDSRAKEVERERASRAAANASMPSGTPPAPAGVAKEYDSMAWEKLSANEFSALSSKGEFRKVGDKIVYTPRS